MRKEYTIDRYFAEKAYVEAVDAATGTKLSSSDKLNMLEERLGYHALAGGLPGLPFKRLSMLTMNQILENPAKLVGMLLKQNRGISSGSLQQLREEGIRALVSRVNQVFQDCYVRGKRNVQSYESRIAPVPPVRPVQPDLFPNLPARVHEIAYLNPDGSRKRRRR